MSATAQFRGEGGSIFTFDLPLSADNEKKVALGYLRRVTSDASEEVAVEQVSVERPAQSAPKADWVSFAVHMHGLTPDEAEAMTKADLIEYTA